jgi:hypothetical protein
LPPQPHVAVAALDAICQLGVPQLLGRENRVS